MQQPPNQFWFDRGRPCVEFRADGSSSTHPVCTLIDCCGEYEAALYAYATTGFAFHGRLPNKRIHLLDGTTRVVRQAYLGIEWLGYRKHVVAQVMLTLGTPNHGLTGYVGAQFFAGHEVCIDYSAGSTLVRPVVNPIHP